MMRTLRCYNNVFVILLITLGRYVAVCVVSRNSNKNQNVELVVNEGESFGDKQQQQQLRRRMTLLDQPHNFLLNRTFEEIHDDDKNRDLIELFVVGGEDVKDLSRYPYMVFLRSYEVRSNGSRMPKATCGAVLIDRNAVLTAAHCVKKDVRDLGEKLQIELMLGYSKHSGSISYSELFVVNGKFNSTVFLHPNENLFNSQGALPQDDFAIIKLNGCSKHTTITLNENRQLDSQNNTSVCIIGYGTESSTSNRLKGTLQKAKLSIDSVCNPWARHLNMNNMMCSSTTNGRGSCKGDSGGPIITCGDNLAEDRLLAIVSFGHKCADASNHPSVNSRVRTSRNWIKSILQMNRPSC